MNSCIHNKFKKEIQILEPDNAFFYSMQDNSQHEHISLFFIQLFLVQDCKDIFCLFLQPWLENMLHVGILQPPLDRDNFPWQHRSVLLKLVDWFMVFNATFNNISVITWRSVLLWREQVTF
jgi:hypothetical protein